MIAKRTDANQSKLIKQIRKLGYSVRSLHTVGVGMGDIIVGAAKRNYLFEVKDPNKAPSKKKLTPDEIVFHQTWAGQIDVVETIEDILKVIKQ